MPVSTTINFWAIVAIMVVFSTLAITIAAAILVHSKKIRESEHRFRLLFDNVFDSIILLDGECKIVDANESFCKIIGYSKRDWNKLSVADLVPSEKGEGLKNEFSKCHLSGMNFLGQTDLVDIKGKIIHVEVGARSIRINGNQFILASFRDIGARIESENALKNKHAALNELIAHIEDEKVKYRQQIAKTIDEVILPTLSKLIKPDGTVSQSQYETLQSGLSEMAVAAGGKIYALGRLTPREIEICNLLRTGKTTKDIAETLDISKFTVNKHREKIRKKLTITKKDINLSTFLKNS